MQIYLAINSLIYIVLGVWSAVQHQKIASKVGFSLNGSQGSAEFIAVYGGLEFALGLIALALAVSPSLHGVGTMGFVILYACLVAFRSYAILTVGSDIGSGWNFYALEILFLSAGVFILVK